MFAALRCVKPLGLFQIWAKLIYLGNEVLYYEVYLFALSEFPLHIQ